MYRANMDPRARSNLESQEQEAFIWRNQLLRAITHVDLMKELYQGWVRASPEDQQNTKQVLVDFVLHSTVSPVNRSKIRLHRLAYYLVETFEHWSIVQDFCGACGSDPTSSLHFSNSFENDLYNMVVLLQETLTSCVRQRLNRAAAGNTEITVSSDDTPMYSGSNSLEIIDHLSETKVPTSEIRKLKSALVFQHSENIGLNGKTAEQNTESGMGEACEETEVGSKMNFGTRGNQQPSGSSFMPPIPAAGGDVKEGVTESEMSTGNVPMVTGYELENPEDELSLEELVGGGVQSLLLTVHELDITSSSESDADQTGDDSSETDEGVDVDEVWSESKVSSGYGSPGDEEED